MSDLLIAAGGALCMLPLVLVFEFFRNRWIGESRGESAIRTLLVLQMYVGSVGVLTGIAAAILWACGAIT